VTVLELADIQGNVLQGYGLPRCAYVNVGFADAAAGRRLLADLAALVTVADSPKPDFAVNVALSYAALERLELPERVLQSFPEEFRSGMAARAGRLGDLGKSAPGGWQPELGKGEIHVLLMVHASSASDQRDIVERFAAYDGVTIAHAEDGRLGDREAHGFTREHFGFEDGFGQPAVAGQTSRAYPGQGVPTGGRPRLLRRRTPLGWRSLAAGEFILGYRDEDGVVPAAPDDPYGTNGTFMVFRKLKQNVPAFRALVKELADEHFSGDTALARAKLAGRFDDGTPLIAAPGTDGKNDFRYLADGQGYACPVGAHIRRANPRDSLPGLGQRTRRHRIIRRGMPYGPPLADGADDGVDRGLLFVCFNASIARQFEVINSWLTGGDAFGLQGGDVLTDRTGAPAMTIEGDPPVLFQATRSREPLITTRGGEYLFLPGRRALAALGGVR
jgi:Dyp-type peroxidase family